MYLKLSKLFYILLVFYMSWFQAAFFQVNNLLMVFGAPMILFLLLHMYRYKVNLKKAFPLEIIVWVVFGLIVLTMGFFNATDKMLHISSVITYFQFLLVTWAIYYISRCDGKVDFFINSFIILAIISALTSLVIAYDYGGGRLTMGQNNNPNTLGLMMTFGIGFILFKLRLHKILKSTFLLLLIILFTYVIILTGSRKSILSGLLLFLFWIFMVSMPQIKSLPLINKIKYLLILIIFIAALYFILYPILVDSILWERLIRLFQFGSETRSGMYVEAWRIFKEYPVFGAGMQQYRVISIYGTYSHSTYAEAIANTGIVGTFIYFSTYLIIGSNYIKESFDNRNNYLSLQRYRILFVMFLMVLFLGASIIHFYSMNSFIFFGIIIAFDRISKKGRHYGKIENNL